MTHSLLIRLYREPALYQTTRLIGYEGLDIDPFWQAAKKLPIDPGKIRSAVYDLTRGDKREGNPPRYELREDVKKYAFQLLGHRPDHPEYKAERQQKFIDELMETDAPPEAEGHAEKQTKRKAARPKKAR